MQKSSNAADYRGLLLSLFILALAAALFVVPSLNSSKAVNKGKGLIERTSTQVPGLENYDIREDKAEVAVDALVKYRQESSKDAAAIADVREGFVRGENALRTRIPTLKVEYNHDIRIPEVITPDVYKSNIERLTAPSTQDRAEILRNFVKENSDLVGVSNGQADALRVTANYTNPNGYMSFAHLEQRINDVPVFRGEVKAGFTKDGRMIRVINNLAPGLDYDSLSSDFRNPVDAVRSAFRHINSEPTKLDIERNDAASNDLKVVFGNGDNATTAEKMYFPTEPGVARPAWRVLIWQPVNAFYVIVDAEDGTMLWRKNISEDQTQSATYSVYTNSNAYINTADSPAPLTPGPLDPTLGTQGAIITSRTNVTLIGNEAPNWGQNNLGWMTDNTNITDGNNVEAGIDRDGTDGVDAPQPGDSGCPGAGCRTFTSTWNPPPGNPAPGDAPLTAQAQRGAVTQMFYVMNLYHDVLYDLGFTEQSFNFQNNNFGRGGVANDRVRAEGQDSSGTDNANFSTPADGGRGRMQMYLWTGPTPDYDGTTDADVIIHEVTHGTSNRLHGNASGLSNNMSRGMGEGWGDFYGHSLLAEPTDPINGIYTTGGYATYLIDTGFTANYYYGIRRFPKAVIAFTGPNGKPHNPFTFQYVNSNCNTLIGTTSSGPNSAFPRGPVGSSTCDQVHNLGEVWSSTLWEVRALMVTRLGFAAGTKRVLQVVTDGMKLAPNGPTFLQERDAIIAAASALPAVPQASADVADVREGFRRRGMGFSASVTNAGTGANNTAVVEAFDFPNAQVVDPFSVSDATGDNDGYPEPGENVTLSVAVTNTTGSTITNVKVNANGGSFVNVGTLNDGQTVSVNIPFTIPGDAVCGSQYTVNIGLMSDAGMQSPKSYMFRLGEPVGGPPAEFTNSTAIDMPNGQPGNTSGPFNPYPSNISVSGLSGQKIMKVRLNGYHHEFEDDLDFLLVGPGGQKYIFMSDVGGSTELFTPITFTVSDTGDTLLPDGSAIMDGTTYKPSNVGANDAFASPAPSAPYSNAAPGGSDTFASVFGTDGANMNGTWSLYGVDDAGSDPGRIDGGWTLIFESDNYTCSVNPPNDVQSRADFDGDGKTDLSVFRPSQGIWYLQQSSAGFAGLNWGLNGDVPVPGDYDGDGKTDAAIFRVTDTMGVGDFFILNSNGFTFTGYEWGSTGDVPVVGDYDGDGNTDIAVFRPSTNEWYIINSSGTPANTITVFGQSGDVPVVGDFDGDGKTDLTVYRSGTWMSQLSGGGTQNTVLGGAGDTLVPADYNGDDKDDVAIFNNTTGDWSYVPSGGGSTLTLHFGLSGDIPVPGDYDGDGTDDVAVYRTGTWYVNRSTAGFFAAPFGLGSDEPVPNAYLP